MIATSKHKQDKKYKGKHLEIGFSHGNNGDVKLLEISICRDDPKKPLCLRCGVNKGVRGVVCNVYGTVYKKHLFKK